MKKSFAQAVFVLAVLAPFVAFAYSSPGKPSGPVNDFAGILSAEQRAALEAALTQNEQATGNEIAVVVIKKLGGDTVENYAVSLFKEWGIGKKGKDNGALLLIAVDDRQMRIEVGYGLEPVLTDATSGSIIRNTISPKFKEGNYYQGITEGVADIISATKGETEAVFAPATKISSRSIFDIGVLVFWFGFMVLQWIGSILARTKSWWLGGVIGALIGIIAGFFETLATGLIVGAVLVPLGFLFDYFVSKEYAKSKILGKHPRWWAGGPWVGGGFGGRSGGGFGGGGSGGGGASGSW